MNKVPGGLKTRGIDKGGGGVGHVVKHMCQSAPVMKHDDRKTVINEKVQFDNNAHTLLVSYEDREGEWMNYAATQLILGEKNQQTEWHNFQNGVNRIVYITDTFSSHQTFFFTGLKQNVKSGIPFFSNIFSYKFHNFSIKIDQYI